MPRARTRREDCILRTKLIEGPLLWERVVDVIFTEKDLEEKLAERLGGREKLEGRKLPDCAWHKVTCRYVVVELKGGSIIKALKQLESFAENFPDIHENVDFYVIEVKGYSKELRRVMKLEPVKGKQGLFKAMRPLRKHRIPWDIRGKEVYIRRVA